MKYLFALVTVCCLFKANSGQCQVTDTLRATTPWDAQWIGTTNGIPDFGDYYGVYCYHKTVNLTAKPTSFYVHVSADNHYKLWINGTSYQLGRCGAIRTTGVMKQ